ncbi:UDP-N-acetylmuramate dehydrogenase [Quadrisphaera granulorum]|uniref:UDP-N-acetylenolpyruvoylglucosamine reductase n=1 Tax=Quadrisphaera granulorum TaxID=317664 RepID=A0A316AET4_9ACTN|nr:UDP-N-acetylmuramate dehydrogenase [Quadrisphaera granulorum]PWJ55490.1 UDP-N-acetylmuramate dehydrogenase [Quadrisphaera granulorum]SZE95554.1 UDP-N-acetylmuramate dehydrogenase [Quadrisphaera granulorum]
MTSPAPVQGSAQHSVQGSTQGSPQSPEPERARLADLTTLRVGGPAARTVVATTRQQVIEAVSSADAAGEPVLVVGGGSNLVVGDDGFDGTVVVVRTRGVELESGDWCGGAFLHVDAGEDWDSLVARAVANGWSGVECLSGIPGTVGATPVQNVGAYGQQLSDVLASVQTWDRKDGRLRTIPAFNCKLRYRDSLFKDEPGRYVILDVVLQLPINDLAAPVKYAELAAQMGAEPGERRPLAEVREAVLALRRRKGMVLDASDHDTWSTGSFFTNPLLTPAQAAALPEDAPRHPDPASGLVKTSAAWLVERAGFPRGSGLDGALPSSSPATLSTKHTLAVTNRGSASAADVLGLARAVRDGVRERFGVELVPEPELVGCAL